jgi:6-phospho-beta-glucosidase
LTQRMNSSSGSKVALLGGGGVRTPLVIYGVQESARLLGVEEMVLYDPDPDRVAMMARLGQAILAREGSSLRLRTATTPEDAIDGAAFVLSSIRVGGIQSRAADERISIDHGYPGQETTGPGGIAMGLRTVRASIEYARLVEKLSPDAWFINFTNPAGLITQAIAHTTGVRIVGICDTPQELFHRIAVALNAPPERVRCEYLGLNHLGWVRRVLLDGRDVLPEILNNDGALDALYQASLFDHELLRCLELLPTEYLYFYYCRTRALANQKIAKTTRGEEVTKLNDTLLNEMAKQLQAGKDTEALAMYVSYLNRRSGSYMKLEASAGSAFDEGQELAEDPFRAATGYHRIALQVMTALRGTEPQRVIVNVANHGAIEDISYEEIVEVPCTIADGSIQPEACGRLPEAVRGLVLAVKAYERAAIEAAITGSWAKARKAMLLYPAIGEWEPSEGLLAAMIEKNPELRHLTK